MEKAPSWRDWLRGVVGPAHLLSREQRREIEASGLFDRTWYLANTPGAAASGLDPLDHYVISGWQCGFSPGPRFDSAWYRQRYNDVAAAGIDPLLHFIRAGRDEGRSPRPSAADLLDDFQSLGCSCEFGFVQRHFNCRVLSLFGFATTTPDGVLGLLESTAPFLGTPDCLQLSIAENGEYMIDVAPHGFRFHTDLSPARLTPGQVRDHELKRLRFLWRKLQEDLEEGGRIFVFRGSSAMRRQHAVRLAAMLRRQAANHLLWVVPRKSPGSVDVENLGNGLMCADIEHSGDGRTLGTFDAWYEVCQRAYDLRARERAASHAARLEKVSARANGHAP